MARVRVLRIQAPKNDRSRGRPTRGGDGARGQGGGGGGDRTLKCFMCGEEHFLRECKNSVSLCDDGKHANRDCPKRRPRMPNSFEFGCTIRNGMCKLCGKKSCPGAERGVKCKQPRLVIHKFQNDKLLRMLSAIDNQSKTAAKADDGAPEYARANRSARNKYFGWLREEWRVPEWRVPE